jgi:hypothetical protein
MWLDARPQAATSVRGVVALPMPSDLGAGVRAALLAGMARSPARPVVETRT